MTTESAENMVNRLVHDVGRCAKNLRLQSDLGQEELAKRIGVDQRGISKFERGGYTRVEFLVSAIKYARYFKIDPAIFLFGTGHADIHTITSDALRIARVYDQSPNETKLAVANLLLNASYHS
jgi:transcriptional regulator with XRE-family HTH domain